MICGKTFWFDSSIYQVLISGDALRHKNLKQEMLNERRKEGDNNRCFILELEHISEKNGHANRICKLAKLLRKHTICN